jgi:hypothetical protein
METPKVRGIKSDSTELLPIKTQVSYDSGLSPSSHYVLVLVAQDRSDSIIGNCSNQSFKHFKRHKILCRTHGC